MLSAEPVCSCAHSFVHIVHETASAARTRLSLRPLPSREGDLMQDSGASRRENADAYPPVVIARQRVGRMALADDDNGEAV